MISGGGRGRGRREGVRTGKSGGVRTGKSGGVGRGRSGGRVGGGGGVVEEITVLFLFLSSSYSLSESSSED